MTSGFCLSVCFSRPYNLCFRNPQGTVLTPTMDHAMSIQPTSMMGPLTQQLSHLSLGSTGTVSNITPTRSRLLSSQDLAPCKEGLCLPTVYSGQHSYAGDLHPTVHPSASLQRPRGKKRSVQTAEIVHCRYFALFDVSWNIFFVGERWSTAAGNHGDPRRAHKLYIPTHKVNLRWASLQRFEAWLRK